MKSSVASSSQPVQRAAAGNSGRSGSPFTDLRPEAALQQNAVQMMQQASVVQRYKTVAAAAYERHPDEAQEQAMFTHQSPDPVPTDVGQPLSLFPRYNFIEKAAEAPPDLRASDDDTVALQLESEPKEFYGTATVLQTANTALNAKNSEFRLAGKGHSLRLAGHDLQMMGPVLAVPLVEEHAQRFADYSTSVCRDFAVKLMNSATAKHEAIFQAATGRGVANGAEPVHRRLITTSNSQRSPELQNVAGELAQSPSYRVLENAFQADTPGNDDTVKGRQYGDAVRTGTVGPKAQEIGVNEFAAPEIGEGFATYSTPAGVSAEEGHEGNALDYSVHVDGLPRPRTWGYHFAGVVAASEDGRDKVTLENYNRADDIENYLQGVYEQLIITHTDIVREKIESLDQMEGIPFRSYFREVFQVIHQAQNLAAESEEQARQEAFDAYTNFMNNRNDGQAWFFQIYGSGAGQTFHERQAAGGSFTNPLTVRVGKVSENVTVLQATLNGLLDNVPGLVANVADPPTYAATLRNSKRQILARTTQADVKAEFNSALAILVRLRKHAIYAGAQAVGGTEGINNVPFDDTAPTFARQRIQTIRNGTGIFKFERKGVLDAKLARLGLMIPRIVQLTQYGVANVQV